MKKLLLLAIFAVFTFQEADAQTFKLGATAGIPTADASDFFSFVLGVDAYYYFTDIDDFIEIGGTVGFRNFTGDDVRIGGIIIEGNDEQFLPIAAAGRVKFFGKFSGGADIGYAVGLSDIDGGFYFRPIVGIDLLNTIELNASYETTAGDGYTFGNLNFGVLFQF